MFSPFYSITGFFIIVIIVFFVFFFHKYDIRHPPSFDRIIRAV